MIYPRLHSKWQTWDLKSTSPNLKQYTVPPPRFLLGRVNTWWSPHDQWVAKAYLQPGTNPQNPAQQPDCHLPSHTPCSLCSLKGLWEIITAHLHKGIGVPQKYHITWGPPPIITMSAYEAISQPLLERPFKASSYLWLHSCPPNNPVGSCVPIAKKRQMQEGVKN